eukprot:TRINITY_DN15532_c0_g1_i1.p1 TRINITY_DN15532_c0_g1~~TRINITY_DN15532_c0_g1_i1.p1  ORF type:complete len:318 (+),score=100.51 TRINITY_DN15532_c0_g1_i1:71-955(+)
MGFAVDIHLKVRGDEPRLKLLREEQELARHGALLRGEAPAPQPAAAAAAPQGPAPGTKPPKGPKGKRTIQSGAEGADEEVPMPAEGELTCRGRLDADPRDTPDIARVKAEAIRLGLTSACFRWVEPCYYSRPLEWRRAALEAPGVEYLCKSVILENTQCTREDCAERWNSRYYQLCFQYVTRFDANKMMKLMRDKNPGIGKRRFNYRCVDDLMGIGGFGKNATAPIALRTDMPVMLSASAARLPFLWLGGGHVDVKMCVDTRQFRAALHPLVLDVCEPLTPEEIAAIGCGGGED